MRLREFASDNIADIIALILKNQITNSNDINSSNTINYNALNNILKNTDAGNLKFNQETFTDLYNSNPMIQSLVSDYNKDGIILSTEKQPEEKVDKFSIGNSQTVKSMASKSNPYK